MVQRINYIPQNLSDMMKKYYKQLFVVREKKLCNDGTNYFTLLSYQKLLCINLLFL